MKEVNNSNTTGYPVWNISNSVSTQTPSVSEPVIETQAPEESGNKVTQFAKDLFVGAGESIKDTITGTVSMVMHPIQTIKGIGYAITHPSLLVQAFVDPYMEAVKSGHPGQAIGRGIVDIGSMFLGPEDVCNAVKNLSKGNRSVQAAADAARAASVVLPPVP